MLQKCYNSRINHQPRVVEKAIMEIYIVKLPNLKKMCYLRSLMLHHTHTHTRYYLKAVLVWLKIRYVVCLDSAVSQNKLVKGICWCGNRCPYLLERNNTALAAAVISVTVNDHLFLNHTIKALVHNCLRTFIVERS